MRDDGTGWRSVADTKYKVLDEAGKVSNADIYQLVTYCARLGLTTGHLIYADGGTAPPPYEVTVADAAIAVHRVDLHRIARATASRGVGADSNTQTHGNRHDPEDGAKRMSDDQPLESTEIQLAGVRKRRTGSLCSGSPAPSSCSSPQRGSSLRGRHRRAWEWADFDDC